ncbi:hypothetical protein MMC25_007311 [Agyrium rufum]|nr:hypothetical protein [Agyrium rufum]
MSTTTTEHKNSSFVLHSPNIVTYEDRPVPELESPHDVIIRVGWTGICGSDIHYYLHGRIGSFVLEKPMVLGHESAGTVHTVGDKVTSLKPGDRVAMEPGIPCRRCVRCKGGNYNLCPEMAFASTPPYDGTLAKFYSLPEDLCYKLPENVSMEEGALIEPAAVAVHITRQANVQPGNSVVVFGAGPVGLLCAGVARGFGAGTVVIVDIVQNRVDFAAKWISGGAKTFMPERGSTPQENAAALLKSSGLEEFGGADIVIDASGAEPSINAAIHVVRRGGTYVQGGMGKDEITFPVLAMCTKEITCKGSFRYGSGDYELAVKLVAEGKLNVKELITGKVAFGDAEKAFEEVRSGKGIKVLIEGVKD